MDQGLNGRWTWSPVMIRQKWLARFSNITKQKMPPTSFPVIFVRVLVCVLPLLTGSMLQFFQTSDSVLNAPFVIRRWILNNGETATLGGRLYCYLIEMTSKMKGVHRKTKQGRTGAWRVVNVHITLLLNPWKALLHEVVLTKGQFLLFFPFSRQWMVHVCMLDQGQHTACFGDMWHSEWKGQ